MAGNRANARFFVGKNMKTKNIKEFYIGEANYFVHGDGGEKIILKLNYWENSYRIEGKSDIALVKEAENIAKDLLGRKSKYNFAENENI